jgi:glycerophosphoryl diester phosphodiesterase
MRDRQTVVRKPLVIAHRGASGLAPENTLAAFRMAFSMGADGIELDVQLSSDGEAMVIHDLRINRTTDGFGAVSSLTADELSTCDAGRWFSRKLARRPRSRAIAAEAARRANLGEGFTNERVPTLGEVLALAAEGKAKQVYIELKGRRRQDKRPLLRRVLEVIGQSSIQDRITLLSFDHDVIKQARIVATRFRTAATFALPGRGQLTARAIKSAVERAEANEAALHYGLATRRLVASLQEQGITVSVWTANQKVLMRRLIAAGADSIMTNFPNRLIETLSEVQ